MTPEQWEKVSEIFHSAIDLEGAEREAFLQKACGEDALLLSEVNSLIAANETAGSFIEEPVIDSVLSSQTALSAVRGQPLNHYTIEKCIGKGGMGEVYLALDTKLHRRVALKRLPAELAADPAFVWRFQNEARAAATLNHPNVATIFSVEESDRGPFLTMEYVEGETLDARVPAGGLNVRMFLSWFIPIAKGLLHAHEKGVTHRDIKPGNIMISSAGVPKILDFGLAQMAPAHLGTTFGSTAATRSGQVIGTPSYMSPEQAEGKSVDNRSDIFSLGIVMYEALTGERPFKGDSNAEIVSNLLKTEPPLVSDIAPNVPQLLARLIARCLSKRRRDRVQNMQEVLTILSETQAMLNRGISTGSLGRRLYREASSPKLRWAAGAVVVILLLSFGAWWIFSENAKPPINFENMIVRRLSQSQNVVFAMISTNGRHVLYNTIEPNEDRSLWIRELDDRNALQLVPPQPVQFWGGLTISSDDSQVYYITASPASRNGTLYRISTLGGTPRKLADEVNDLGSLSPAGDRVLYVRHDGGSQIFSADAKDGSAEELVQGRVENKIYRDPQFTPDGRSVVYIENCPVNGVEMWSLVRLKLDDRTVTEIIPPRPERIGEVVVLRHSGGYLLNAADPVSNLSQIYYAAGDGKLQRITNDVSSYFGLSIDEKEENIVAAQRSDEKRIWVGDAADPAGTMKPVSPEPNAFTTVEWTPDGRLVFDALDNNRPHIWASDANGQNISPLTPPNTTDLDPKVSPDGRYIIFASLRLGPDQIWRMNADGSGQVQLVNISGAASNASFSPDGQNVFFQWTRDAGRSIGRVPIAGGDVTEFPLPGNSIWALSPDGTKIAYAVRDDENKWKVMIAPIAGDGTATTLPIAPIYLMKWRADGKALIFRDRTGSHSQIMECDINGGKPRVFYSASPDYFVDVSFSADQKRVAIIRGRLITDAVALSRKTDK